MAFKIKIKKMKQVIVELFPAISIVAMLLINMRISTRHAADVKQRERTS
ncbi:MAG TPA: hypothetical protein VD927_17205 [Chryseosolibacter sp.]|nr:hypothetical protein [Chryseosolibacter sp.]